ncbi:MFS transporter [Prevotella cerevisiae]|uniref:MFS transporter n=1 Tax=Segatella cerevisiae TaxID=2053716 RepID=A0ABT1BVK6_9BACT|nr:MFS transporter [Segatella cerevisiae]MCO6024452.1 MFS transporter [Segatella cerevisiae]
MSKNKFLVPLIYIGIMYFTVGFTLGINSYLVPLLQSALKISAGQSYLVLAANFAAFLLFSYPASLLIRHIGYKRTMSLSFLFYAIGFLLFIPSSALRSLGLFLLASFISGTANATLQSAINPYVTILGPIDSAAKRMSLMGICNSCAWAIAPIVLGIIIGKPIKEVSLNDTSLPFIFISIFSVILAVIMYKSPLKEIKAVGEDEGHVEDCPYAASKKSIWEFPHLILGAITLFLYVEVETIARATPVDYATNLNLANPDYYAILPSIGMVVGYICGIFLIPKYLSQNKALRICSFIAIIGSLLVILAPPDLSIYCITFIALGCSLMYPSLWPLAIVDLGRFTKTGSSLLVTSIVGGAVIPTIFGFMKDSLGNQNAYWICVPCFLVVMFYAFYGYKIRTHEAQTTK